VAAVVLVNASASYWNVRTLAATHQWVAHTYQVLTGLQSTLSLLKDAETGQRGYLLTGRAHYLEPYEAAITQLPERLAGLRELTADNHEQQRRLAELEVQVQAKLNELRQAIGVRQQKGLDEALEVVRVDRGKLLMDEIRGTVFALEAAEQRALEDRATAADLRVRRTLGTIVVVTALALVFHFLRALRAERQPRPPSVNESSEEITDRDRIPPRGDGAPFDDKGIRT
jgi:CHASE3 domain sensor protein